MKAGVFLAFLIFLGLWTAPANSAEPTRTDNVAIGLNVGNRAPDIIENSRNGETLKLSSLRGQIVLIDFWASWCGPCRRENPVLVEAFEKYKNKTFTNGNGFTIFSVSLDKNQQAWDKAIEDDKLIWQYHVSDLKGWYSKYAGVYGVRSIPSNFLIDGDGIIVGKNLIGSVLDSTLEKLLK